MRKYTKIQGLRVRGGYTPGSARPRRPIYTTGRGTGVRKHYMPEYQGLKPFQDTAGNILKTYGRVYKNRLMSGLSDFMKSEPSVRFVDTLRKEAKMRRNIRKLQSSVQPLQDMEKGIATVVKGRPKMDKTTVTNTIKLDMAGPVKQRSFYTTFNSGKPTSKPILMAAKQNGTKTEELFNSLTYLQLNDLPNDTMYREALELYTGFNQKSLFTNVWASPNWSQIYEKIYKVTQTSNSGVDASAPNPNDTDKSLYTKLYGCGMSISSKYVFRNNMNTTSAVVKVHLVIPKNTTVTNIAWDKPLVAATDTSALSVPVETQRVIKVASSFERPYVRQATTYAPSVMSEAVMAILTPAADLVESDTFNDRFTIVKTFARTLDVGDDWHLTVNRTLGSGLRLDEAARVASQNAWTYAWTDIPFGYRVVFEIVGKPIQAEYVRKDTYTGTAAPAAQTALTGEDKVVGTAPCSVNMEIRHQFKYVLQSYSGVPAAYNEPDFNSRVGAPLIRAFVVDATKSAVPFNMDYWKTNGNTTYLAPIKIATASTGTVQTVTTTN